MALWRALTIQEFVVDDGGGEPLQWERPVAACRAGGFEVAAMGESIMAGSKALIYFH